MQWTGLKWRNHSIRTKTRIAVVLPMLALLLSCGLIAWVSSQHEDANRWVIHTLQVRLKLAGFEQQFRTAETRLTRHPEPGASHLPDYGGNTLDEARSTLLEIQRLTSDNPSQQRRIKQLLAVFNVYADSAASSSSVLSGTSEGQARVAGDVQRLVADMDAEESRLLTTRTDRSGELEAILYAVITGTLLIGVAGTLLATSLLSRNVCNRIAQLVQSSVLMREGLPIKTLEPSKDEIGQLASTLAQTSRVLIERAGEIAESNWKLESVLNAATSASIIAEDSAGRITLFSTGAARLLGYSPDEVMGRDLGALLRDGILTIHHDLRVAHSVTDPDGKQPGATERDAVYIRKDGLPLHVHVAETPLKNLSGQFVGRLHVAQDITSRKVLEEELRTKLHLRQQKKESEPGMEDEEAQLPEWLKSGESDKGERLMTASTLNRWYETQGHIPNPHEENVGHYPRILIVDDFEATRFLLRVYLQGQGYQLDFASNGKEALEHVARGTYDLILMDVEMPEMDGYEAASRIRTWEEAQGRDPVAIVALSAQDPEELPTNVWTSYIQKPVSKGQLLEAVAHCLEKRAVHA
jgi:PAS domain S-box-containing protein